MLQRDLLRDVWGPDYGDEANYLRVFMGQIRKKIEPDPRHPRYFVTEPGLGLRFENARKKPPAIRPGDSPPADGECQVSAVRLSRSRIRANRRLIPAGSHASSRLRPVA